MFLLDVLGSILKFLEKFHNIIQTFRKIPKTRSSTCWPAPQAPAGLLTHTATLPHRNAYSTSLFLTHHLKHTVRHTLTTHNQVRENGKTNLLDNSPRPAILTFWPLFDPYVDRKTRTADRQG